MAQRPIALPPEFIPSDIGVYVHLPFCSARCYYCGFHSSTKLDDEVVAQMLERLLAEARSLMALLEKPRIDTVYIGGGTPSAVPARLLCPFLERLADALGIASKGSPPSGKRESDRGSGAPCGGPEWKPHATASRPGRPSDLGNGDENPASGPGFSCSQRHAGAVEWTVEANPETVGPDFLLAVNDSPANRISLGVQSFDDGALQTLGRQASRERIDRALDLLVARWSGRRSLDLIAGIPGRTPEAAAHDAELAGATGIEHVSLYQLTPEPGTPLLDMLAAGQLQLDQHMQEEAWLAAAERLLATGLADYEVSNFAQPNGESRHNQRYWRMHPYVGIGPSAVGTLRSSARAPDVAAVRLTRSAFGGLPPKYSIELLDSDTLAFELCMVGLRTAEGVDLSDLARLTGSDATRPLLRGIEDWAGFKYIDRERLRLEGRLALIRPGRRILDHLLTSLELPRRRPSHASVWTVRSAPR